MEAHTLNCLMCGAPTSTDLPNCAHCGARLAKVSCPSCFAMIFEGSKFCPHCGSRADRAGVTAGQLLECPKCNKAMGAVQVGDTTLVECIKCHGLWVDNPTFEKICESREEQAAVLGHPMHMQSQGTVKDLKVRYVRCPVCRDLMHRVNFAKCSGVVLDICKRHGTWFDRDELKHIIDFIRTGGMEKARKKEIAELEEARRRAAEARSSEPIKGAMYTERGYGADPDPLDLVSMAGGLLRILLKLK